MQFLTMIFCAIDTINYIIFFYHSKFIFMQPSKQFVVELPIGYCEEEDNIINNNNNNILFFVIYK